MGYKVSHVEFKDGLPEIEAVVKLLGKKVAIEVEHSTHGYSDHRFSFNPRENKTPCVIIESNFFSRQNLVSIDYDTSLESESLNKYPNYFHFSLVSTLVELGGKPGKELPFYSNFSWQDWVKLNGRATPPFFKVLVRNILAFSLAFVMLPLVKFYVAFRKAFD